MVKVVPVEYKHPSGEDSTASVKIIDFDEIDNNDWFVVNQFTVNGPEKNNRRPDITVFINGLPIAVIELKNASDENAMASPHS
jgi:type I restriction enzyme R subunit